MRLLMVIDYGKSLLLPKGFDLSAFGEAMIVAENKHDWSTPATYTIQNTGEIQLKLVMDEAISTPTEDSKQSLEGLVVKVEREKQELATKRLTANGETDESRKAVGKVENAGGPACPHDGGVKNDCDGYD